jgi:hydroxypyruvate isomerase
MKISVCVEAVYNKKDFIASMREVKSLGIDAVEFWSWWDKDIDKINAARKELDLNIAAFCTKMVSLVDPSQRKTYISGLEETVPVAKKLGCKTIISQVGNELPSLSREAQHKSLVKGLKKCSHFLEAEGLTLVIEPLNIRVDHKGYYLWESDEAADIVSEVGSPNVLMLFDIYHQQIMEGDVIRRSIRHLNAIGHMHAAGNPGRNELDSGELNYMAIFDALQSSGYTGYVGLEYFPVREAKEGLLPWVENY